MLSKTLLALCSITQIAAQRSLVFTALSAGKSDDAATQSQAPPACATFHGTYEGTSVYAIDEQQCAPRAWLDTLESASVVSADDLLGWNSAEILLHVQPARISGASHPTPQTWSQMVDQHLSTAIWQMDQQNQHVAHPEQQVLVRPVTIARPRLLHLDSQKPSAFYSLPASSLPHVDSMFPSNSVLVAVSQDPLPAPPHLAQAEKAPQWLLDSLRDVHYSPLVDAMLQDVNPNTIEKDVKHLTAEDGHSDWRTRHSFTEDGRRAGKWIKCECHFLLSRYQAYIPRNSSDLVEKEAGIKCRYHEHDEGFSPNIIW